MSKKRRSRKSSAARRRRTTTSAQRQPRVRAPSAQPEAKASTQGVDFSSEYRYVLADLKRFAMVAAAMVATLVALALIIH